MKNKFQNIFPLLLPCEILTPLLRFSMDEGRLTRGDGVNHADNIWHWNGRTYRCKPGQLITSLNSLAAKCGRGVTRRKVQTALRFFENCGFLVRRTARHNTLMTMCNWDTYQNIPDAVLQQFDSQRTSGGQEDVTPMPPNKKPKKKE